MESVIVNKTELLAILKQNKFNHLEAYKLAVENYKKALIVKLEEMLAEAKAEKPVNHNIGLSVPVQYTKEYEKAIRMMEMSIEENIVLSEFDFNNYVLDDWNWKGAFRTSNSGYLSNTMYASI